MIFQGIRKSIAKEPFSLVCDFPEGIRTLDVDPEQTALGPHYLPLRLLKHFSRRDFAAIGALRVRRVFYVGAIGGKNKNRHNII